MSETKTWPYGTQRKATVIQSNWRPKGLDPRAASGQFLLDELGEGHICVGDTGDTNANAGDTGVLTFTKGGPTGGYWKFTKDPKPI